jgi:hypothetical protein
MIRLKFRPSSHSDDFTLLAHYKTSKEADKAGQAIHRLLEDMKQPENSYETDWEPDEATVSVDGNKVTFEVDTAGYLEDVYATLAKTGATNIESFQSYQEFTIQLVVPLKTSIEALPLILKEDDVSLLKWLTETCGQPKIMEEDNQTQIQWVYRGDGIYNESENVLYGKVELNLNENSLWRIVG